MPIALYLMSITIFLVVRISFIAVIINAILFHIALVFVFLYFGDRGAEYTVELFVYFFAAAVSGIKLM